MPSRWWIPVTGIDAQRVRLEHLHAVVSGWFDATGDEHTATTKPYALSPMASPLGGSNTVGFEVSALTRIAFERLQAAVGPGQAIRLGGQRGRIGPPERVAQESWDSLAQPSGARDWELEFLTPVTFRSRNRSSPWPAPASVLRGLSETWNHFSGLTDRVFSHQQLDTIWVSDISGHSEPMTLATLKVSGFVGRIRYRCDDQGVADLVDGLLRLAVYSGIGSAKAKGLGVTRLADAGRAAGNASRAG